MKNWDKKIHVESSLIPKDGQHAMFVGRWQPLHKGHQELFNQALEEGKNVLICIRTSNLMKRIHLPFQRLKQTLNHIIQI